MIRASVPLRRLDAPPASALPDTPLALLRWLGGPACIRVPGRDRSRARAVVTLLHGNEPSGVHALHAWLRRDRVPAVDVLLVVGAVEAALLGEGFAHRTRPGGPDLNRCFAPPREGPECAFAASVRDALAEVRPEAVLDLHHTTGHTPPYCVTANPHALLLRLVALFGDRCVHTGLRIGAMIEYTATLAPSLVVECGLAGSPEADAVAAHGLERFLEVERLDALPARGDLLWLDDPVRVRAAPGVRVLYGFEPAPDAPLTLDAEVDRHNFEPLDAGARLGWVADAAPWPIEAQDARGADVSRELFEIRDGRLATRRHGVPIMITTDPEIAKSDCLFYFARQRSPSEPRGR